MTLAIWHGYLLGATGSNIYSRHLIRAWVRAGHDVVLACQEPEPEAYPEIHDLVVLARDRETNTVAVAFTRTIREPEPGHGRCTMVVPDVHGLLPVYVMDRYEGYEVKRVVDLTNKERGRYGGDHAAALEWVLDEFAPAGVLINHASPLPAALAPVLTARGVPFAVKVHGSELEYALVEDDTLVRPATAALSKAASVLVGSGHIERRTRELLGPAALDGRVATIPPGVDLDQFQPLLDTRAVGTQRLLDALAERAVDQAEGRTPATGRQVEQLVEAPSADLMEGLAQLQGSYQERHVEASAVAQLDALDLATGDPVIAFIGKLIPQKGVQLLLAALPTVLTAHPTARVVIAGFGPLRDGLEALLVAMQSGNVDALDTLAAGLGSLSGEGGTESEHLVAWLGDLRARGELDAWLAECAETRVAERVAWLGLVDHAILARLWPLADMSVVPSILSEAFGMVAAEAASCGCVPVVADHSGLADAAAVIELDGVAPIRVSLEGDPAAVIPRLAETLSARLALPAVEQARQAAAARDNVARVWGWDRLAAEVADAMTGRLRA
ncbi:MAG: glycosyl transferase group 1 [Thermoleophilia bacterium]|nr:glycosyl transferase group 1 [Thermoleophilia bacterium]